MEDQKSNESFARDRVGVTILFKVTSSSVDELIEKMKSKKDGKTELVLFLRKYGIELSVSNEVETRKNETGQKKSNRFLEKEQDPKPATKTLSAKDVEEISDDEEEMSN